MTLSIVARDPATGAFGIATATAGPMVGALVPHGRSGIGAVATQAMTNPYLAVDALEHLTHGTAETALAAALANDPEHQRRQIIVIDRQGASAGFTGTQCEAHAGHVLDTNVAVAGNILAGPGVLSAMMETFAGSTQSGLAASLIAALGSGARAGGDRRGHGSAALKVYGTEAFPDLDLRVDRAADPLTELATLLTLATQGGYAEFFAQVPRRGRRS